MTLRARITIPLSGLYMLAGTIKVVKAPRSLEVRDRHRVPAPVWTAIGATGMTKAAEHWGEYSC